MLQKIKKYVFFTEILTFDEFCQNCPKNVKKKQQIHKNEKNKNLKHTKVAYPHKEHFLCLRFPF